MTTRMTRGHANRTRLLAALLLAGASGLLLSGCHHDAADAGAGAGGSPGSAAQSQNAGQQHAAGMEQAYKRNPPPGAPGAPH